MEGRLKGNLGVWGLAIQSWQHSLSNYSTINLSDMVIFNAERHDIRLLELTCLFNSTEHLQAARERKSSKMEYQLLISELDHLGFACQYVTVEIGCLGHYLPETINPPENNPAIHSCLSCYSG